MNRRKKWSVFAAAALCALVLIAFVLSACRPRPNALPAFGVDLNQTSVSGVSSGAFMAVQFEVAYSAIVKGAGIIAGGPYYCAQDDIFRALSVCTCINAPKPCNPVPGATDVSFLAKTTEDYAGSGRIDPVSRLSNHRVFLFSGMKDSIVPQAVMNDLEIYYRVFLPAGNIRYRKDMPAQHGMPTDSYGNECGHLGEPFINNCGFDAAGELLKQIYGTLKPRNTGKLSGSFIRFDQGEFIEKPGSHSMDDSGWAYVPASCKNGRTCRVHVAFHGCRQGQRDAGMAFIEHAGYNEWADTNGIIVLYPQVIPKKTFGFPGTGILDAGNHNPEGCWNWWGYDHDGDYAVKSGRQMSAVKAMLDRLSEKPGARK